MTQIENLYEIVSLGGQVAVDSTGRILEAEKPDEKPATKPDDADTQARAEAEKIVNDHVDWELTIAVSPASLAERRKKMAELKREYTRKIAPYIHLFGESDASKPVTNVTHEAEARRMFANVGLSGVSGVTVSQVAECLQAGNTAKAAAIVSDWAKASGNARFANAVQNVQTVDDAVRLLTTGVDKHEYEHALESLRG